MHACIHTYIQTHIHTYRRTHTYTHTRTYIHTYIHTYTHTYIHTHTHTYIHTQTYMHAYIHTYIRAYVHTYIRTYIHTCIHTYIQTDTQTDIQHPTITGRRGGGGEPKEARLNTHPHHAALTMWFAKNTQHDSWSNAAPVTQNDDRWRCPKCCACHETCNSSSGNNANVLRMLHKTTLDTFWNMLECHKVPHLPLETKLRDVWDFLKSPLCRTRHKECQGDTSIRSSRRRLRTVANGCEWLPTVADGYGPDGCATSSERTSTPRTPRVKREPLLRIWARNYSWCYIVRWWWGRRGGWGEDSLL